MSVSIPNIECHLEGCSELSFSGLGGGGAGGAGGFLGGQQVHKLIPCLFCRYQLLLQLIYAGFSHSQGIGSLYHNTIIVILCPQNITARTLVACISVQYTSFGAHTTSQLGHW